MLPVTFGIKKYRILHGWRFHLCSKYLWKKLQSTLCIKKYNKRKGISLFIFYISLCYVLYKKNKSFLRMCDQVPLNNRNKCIYPALSYNDFRFYRCPPCGRNGNAIGVQASSRSGVGRQVHTISELVHI